MTNVMNNLVGTDLGVTPKLTKNDGVPTTDEPQKGKDFTSDQEVRWCPGCGDYVILNTMRNFLPDLGLRRENIVFISGIGCSSRFPYYLETYGFHSIHGRAPAIATGLALGAEATFVGRALDSDRAGLTEVLRGAAEHRGAAVVEILQDCPIFNDGSFDALRKEGAEDRVINVRHGEPIVFGTNGEYCVVKSGFSLEVAKTADVAVEEIVVHDAHA